MDCQYVATQRGGVALVFEGHRYNKVRDGKDGTVYWRCSRDRQCPGRAVTVNHRVKKANNKHNHPPESSLQRNGTHSSSHSSSSISLNNITTPTTTSVNNNNSNIINNNNNNNNSHNNVYSHSSLNRIHNCSPSIPSSINSSSSILTGNNTIAHTDTSPHHSSHPSSHHLHSHSHSRVPLSTSRSSPSHSTSSSTTAITQPPSSHLSIQDVIDAHTAVAASFPANFVTEIAKYFASCATGNPHMAAAFASSIASLTPPSKSYNTGRTSSSISVAPFIPEGLYTLPSIVFILFYFFISFSSSVSRHSFFAPVTWGRTFTHVFVSLCVYSPCVCVSISGISLLHSAHTCCPITFFISLFLCSHRRRILLRQLVR